MLIDFDGTRYQLATPRQITRHSGASYFNGKEFINDISIGIEFHGNTHLMPLTDEQINSAIDYLLPIIKQYNIPLENIVTHKHVRTAYLNKYPDKKKAVPTKSDITPQQHKRFMKALKERM